MFKEGKLFPVLFSFAVNQFIKVKKRVGKIVRVTRGGEEEINSNN